jgi:hypothetical protein
MKSNFFINAILITIASAMLSAQFGFFIGVPAGLLALAIIND